MEQMSFILSGRILRYLLPQLICGCLKNVASEDSCAVERPPLSIVVQEKRKTLYMQNFKMFGLTHKGSSPLPVLKFNDSSFRLPET